MKEVFSSPLIQGKLNNLKLISETDFQGADNVTDGITDVIVTAGDMTLPCKSFQIQRKKTHKFNKKQYDKDCHTLLRELKSTKNAFNRNTANDNFRMRYYKKFKERRKFKENLTNMLNEAMENDPQTAWKIINELKRESVCPDNVEKINQQKWFDHFHKLLNTKTSHTEVGKIL